MALSAKSSHQRAKIAALSRSRTPDDPELTEARKSLAYQRLTDHAEKVVADWPVPTPEQLAAVVAILRAGGAS